MNLPTANPRALLESLDAEALARRVEELDDERRALMILLRVARRMSRNQPTAADPTTNHDRQPAEVPA